ncbi:RecF recombinational DNA repair ATPase (plasmid) [Legionella adelaidensis]|uniref:DNA replication and repair protein RecF n=1 Tax=Legionella adelaidensis TaxID=45056 RepID=A0A0W0R126_9GAMM|nr:DNA replication/repair protein RecF [Legionella adelaidensis]KTC64799.1 RecF recombinational DNA repair ATPase [Legionella adelaidensis]VEH86213.1 RecF recombinational DNA repair ATPase [Legionella adelaidensis]
MIIDTLHIHNLRNISLAKIQLHPRFNFFFGENGSGKTSLLESIYLLSTGHSFRTREISPLVQIEKNELTVFCKSTTEETISIQKSLHQSTKVLINKNPCYSSSELAFLLPCQLFYQDIFEIIDAGPSVRRTILDWGLFHVEPNYHQLWKDYRRVLKQRNSLLRQNGTAAQFLPWDTMLVTLANKLHQIRENYFKELQQSFSLWLKKLTSIECSIHYFKGWSKRNSQRTLEEVLQEQFESDRLRQYTQSGPHNADILFETHPPRAKLTLSRGQQKIILIALKLAQAHLISKECIYLLDDIAAEMDMTHLSRLFDAINELPGQFIITALNINNLPALLLSQNHKVFHVIQGQIS